ncbi:energy-coupling factor transporter ATPase [Caldicoprobacter algeriensis]|uniref:energy-coupling factor transporter ATPase n=1 Tax=Caldicoprobacter algeriensis TaxID=699281 RepID=UPI00207A7215|nr:energy-coupling factor transporter ATPase [Caldicoprobacter algeriensis]MCM8900357.1 energy-coupling factor transporter ATPase [Caldicoprobacter algeriensis]
MEPIIRLQDVQFEYLSFEGEEIAALNGVTLDIQKGEFVAIIGHNGSGKSTLAKHLNALLRPSGGVVWIKGMDTRDEDKVWEIRQTAGMVFQNPDNQLVATIVEEDVAFGPENLGLTPEEIQKRVAEALKVVGMQEYAQAAPHYLSGGQKQRVAIAGILAMKPEIIVLDEPTAMLDPVGRREVMETVKYLNKHEGITVVHITHYMEEAVDADRIIVMEHGKIVLQGTPRQVFSQVEVLKEIGLDVPQVTELAYRLRAEGLDVPLNVLKVEEMVDAICRL